MRFQQAVMDLRQAALERIERLFPATGIEAGMMQAILIGQSFQLQKVWTEDWRSTGTFHALVISGTHVAVLTAFLLFCCGCASCRGARDAHDGAGGVALCAGDGMADALRPVGGRTDAVPGRRGIFSAGSGRSICWRRWRSSYLLTDPRQLFDPELPADFLAVGFLAAFAMPLIEATSGPLTYGLSELADTGRDLRLPARVAQFRIEMRLLAKTFHVPFTAVTAPARVPLLSVRGGRDLGDRAARAGAPDGGLFPSRGRYRDSRPTR